MTQPAKRSFKRKFRVCYPPGTGTLVIRTELDWERDVHPSALSSDGSTATFEIEAQQPFVHFKPCLIKNGSLHWAVGTNNLLIMAGDDDRVVYPFFFSDARGRFSPLVEVESAILDRRHRLRVYLPPGYEENTLARYPFAYMQDGQNLFFPHEAFQHKDWGVKETSQILRAMQAIEDFIIVGVYSVSAAKRNTPSRVTRLMRVRSWKSLCLLSNCFLGQPGTDSTEQCGVPR